MKKFALIGAAGFVAPRHLRAIKETGHSLVAALDTHDTVGILDSYFPDTRFFTEFERFDRHIEKLRRNGEQLDYVSIVSPNYLHDAHCRFAMRVGADAICEKPLVINPWNLDGLKAIEEETGRRVFAILQLRHHPGILDFKERVRRAIAEDRNASLDIDLTYVTSRGPWYFTSWKGDERRSGGVAANIGIHFFDMLIWVFGPVRGVSVDFLTDDAGAGRLEFEQANVNWLLSVNAEHLPIAVREQGQRTYRSLRLNDEEIEFSDGFTDLHTESYRRILAGEGFGLEDARPSIELVHRIRQATPEGGRRAEDRPVAKKTAGR